MAREWLLRGVDPEELKKEEVEVIETPKTKWENFWYHHKWTFWGCVFAAVALIIVFTQMFTNDSPDYRVLLMTEDTYFSGDVEKLEKVLAEYGTDLNDDGQVLVNIQNCRMGKKALGANDSGSDIVMAHLQAGDVLFFIWDAPTYKFFMDSVQPKMKDGVEFLSDLDIEGATLIEEGKIYTWPVDAEKLGLAGKFPDQLYFGIRATAGSAADAKELYDQSMALLKAFVAGQNAN